jgi:hypothetical protein
MAAKGPRSKGKSMFVKEVLNENPRANAAIVNEAWRVAGMSGSISAGLVNHLRSRLGFSGNLKKKKRTGTKSRRSSVSTSSRATTGKTSRGRRSSSDLTDLEAEIDRLLMKVVEIGQLSEVEDSLRKARRQLYEGLAART